MKNSTILLGAASYLTLAIILFGLFSTQPAAPQQPADNLPLVIETDTPKNVTELTTLLISHGLEWPLIKKEVPALLIKALPQDMPEIYSSEERKSIFLRTLLPIVLLENHHIEKQRAILEKMVTQQSELNNEQVEWLEERLNHYRLSNNADGPNRLEQLLQRLDQLPPSLMLAQGAIESGWGTSRFALQGNSLFGQWSYSKNSGLIPEARNQGAQHVVRSFDSLQASVRAYMRNLNTHLAYKKLREIRSTMRTRQQPLNSIDLADGLLSYSQRGAAYVEDVKLIIRSNKLTQYDTIELLHVAPTGVNVVASRF
ncbi:MAG: glucosaminidase domain-containing protein [Gammaproteobacteria bacterium]|nr:glucosaminidase domain-containing protein [Gammaproteobacteria bacterium]MCF6231320.1 glucosaminidase domain-containing protein [Gammaproteobacteria bacterium]